MFVDKEIKFQINNNTDNPIEEEVEEEDEDEEDDDDMEIATTNNHSKDSELQNLEDDAGKALWESDEVVKTVHSKSGGDAISKSKNNEAESVALPIHEDHVAHSLIKQIIQFEVRYENRQSDDDDDDDDDDAAVVDTSLWDNDKKSTTTETTELTFTEHLINYFSSDENRLRIWLNCNRSCFVIVEMLKLNSIQSKFVNLLKDPKFSVHEFANKHSGAKTLNEQLVSFQTIPNSKKNKKSK